MWTRLLHGFSVGILLSSPAQAAQGPTLSISRSGTGFAVAWDGGGVLQSADQVNGPWKHMADAVSPHQLQNAERQRFFRVWDAVSLTVTKTGKGTGAIRSEPAGIECGSSCNALFSRNAVVTLTAIPDAGSVFKGWTGDGVGSEARRVTMDGPRSVTAAFETATAAGGGIVNGDFEAGPDVGWEQDPYPVIIPASELGISAVSGRYLAWLGYAADNRHSAAIGQQVTLPMTWPIYLNMAVWIYSEEICDAGYWDTFGLYIDGAPFEENPRVCRGNTGGDGWRLVSFNLSAYAGQTVFISFRMWTGFQDPLASVAVLDDVSISSAPW